MLFVVFQLESDIYAVDAGQVAEVLPMVALKSLPGAGKGVAGVFSYQRQPVPVLDLSALTLDRPAHPRLSTRLLLVHYPTSLTETRLLGLIAEKATETVRLPTEAFHEAGIKNDGAPYLGPVAEHPRGLLQWIRVEQLLPAPMREKLFNQAAEEVSA
ncbi:MAG: chemotaxis protein CheW [Synoicihabitans sp.]